MTADTAARAFGATGIINQSKGRSNQLGDQSAEEKGCVLVTEKH